MNREGCKYQYVCLLERGREKVKGGEGIFMFVFEYRLFSNSSLMYTSCMCVCTYTVYAVVTCVALCMH